jgi:hypothetical protein
MHFQEKHQNEYQQQMESLQPYRMEIQRINMLCDQVAGIKKTMNECKYQNQINNFLYSRLIHSPLNF